MRGLGLIGEGDWNAGLRSRRRQSQRCIEKRISVVVRVIHVESSRIAHARRSMRSDEGRPLCTGRTGRYPGSFFQSTALAWSLRTKWNGHSSPMENDHWSARYTLAVYVEMASKVDESHVNLIPPHC